MSQYLYLLLAKFDHLNHNTHTKKIIGTFNSFNDAHVEQKKLCPISLRSSYRINSETRLQTWVIRVPQTPQGIITQAIDIHTSVET